MSESLSLESVKTEYELWRQQKKSPQCHTPKALKQKALALRAFHSDTDIVKALDISYSRLRHWEPTATSKAATDAPGAKPDFIPLSLGDHTQAVESGSLSITCEQVNGCRWQLQGCFSAQQLSAFVAALQNQAGGCQ